MRASVTGVCLAAGVRCCRSDRPKPRRTGDGWTDGSRRAGRVRWSRRPPGRDSFHVVADLGHHGRHHLYDVCPACGRLLQSRRAQELAGGPAGRPAGGGAGTQLRLGSRAGRGQCRGRGILFLGGNPPPPNLGAQLRTALRRDPVPDRRRPPWPTRRAVAFNDSPAPCLPSLGPVTWRRA